ncbi:MAG TPA: hypothetical protein VGQ04_01835 [Chitinophagaceae bacterium]|nr:hypothetical protein [Chitinophagaceae bacterium]
MRKYFLLTAALNSTILITAQVQVRNEPRHHNVFENEFVRILDVYLPPKDTTQYHIHNTPSVFIILTNTNVGSQLIGNQPQKGANITGEISYDSLNTPRTHRVWNEDTGWFHVMDIELTSKRANLRIPPLQNPMLKLLFNKEQVNGYEIEIRPGGNLLLPPSSNGYLLISKSETVIDYKITEAIQHRIMKAGHYLWIEAGKPITIMANNQTQASFVLLQLK